MIHHVVRFIADDRKSLYEVTLQGGQVFTGWEACRAIRTRHKKQGVWTSPQEVYMEKADVKELEEIKKKQKNNAIRTYPED